jgi:hypothetical protein
MAIIFLPQKKSSDSFGNRFLMIAKKSIGYERNRTTYYIKEVNNMKRNNK